MHVMVMVSMMRMMMASRRTSRTTSRSHVCNKRQTSSLRNCALHNGCTELAKVANEQRSHGNCVVSKVRACFACAACRFGFPTVDNHCSTRACSKRDMSNKAILKNRQFKQISHADIQMHKTINQRIRFLR